jgi:hypothetical protein
MSAEKVGTKNRYLFWTKEHKAIVREFYPVGGVEMCLLKIKYSRTREAIKVMASRLKVRSSRKVCKVRDIRVRARKQPSQGEQIKLRLLEIIQRFPARCGVKKIEFEYVAKYGPLKRKWIYVLLSEMYQQGLIGRVKHGVYKLTGVEVEHSQNSRAA